MVFVPKETYQPSGRNMTLVAFDMQGILAMLEEEEDEEENDEQEQGVRQNQNRAAETSTTRRQNRSRPSSSAADAIEPWFVKVKRANETAVTTAAIGAALAGHTEASKLRHGSKSAHKLTAACEKERAIALGP